MKQIKGWKTITGVIIYGLAQACLAMSASTELHTAYPELVMWLRVSGMGLEAIGGPLAIVGLGHKVIKAEEKKLN
jgi:hypothetical protein